MQSRMTNQKIQEVQIGEHWVRWGAVDELLESAVCVGTFSVESHLEEACDALTEAEVLKTAFGGGRQKGPKFESFHQQWKAWLTSVQQKPAAEVSPDPSNCPACQKAIRHEARGELGTVCGFHGAPSPIPANGWNHIASAKLYGFWSHGHYPYVLAGPITHLHANGNIKAENYPGFTFTPVKILPAAAGQELHKKLRALEAEYLQAQRELRLHFANRVVNEFGPEAKAYPDLSKVFTTTVAIDTEPK